MLAIHVSRISYQTARRIAERVRLRLCGKPTVPLFRFGSVMMCDSFHADVHAGNLLVLKDGRVAFIDFGIVGRISPQTWNAMQALSTAAVTSDFETMAVALAQVIASIRATLHSSPCVSHRVTPPRRHVYFD
jgi:hypothetical protein